MVIIDWSSDVCSSDLHQDAVEDQVHTEGGGAAAKAFAKVSRKSRDTPSPGSGNREQGTGEQGTGIAPGPADAVPPPADVLRGPHPAVSYVLTVQTNTGAEWGVTAEMVGEWQKTFPGIDVLASLRREIGRASCRERVLQYV